MEFVARCDEDVAHCATRGFDHLVEEPRFPGPQVVSHISARAQERILSEGCRHDARVVMLDSAEWFPREAREEARVQRVAPHPTHSTLEGSWADLDRGVSQGQFWKRGN